jgi:WD40 repeat protein
LFTRQLKFMLNVTSVTTREDIEDKVHLLLNAPWKDRAGESEDDSEKNELFADRVGMYALIKAGYAPRALAENLDRVAANKGHTGNFLTDVLGTTSEISMRVRTARKIAASLPGSCGTLQPGSSPEFKAFQDAVREAPIHPLIEATAGLNSIKLDPPMRAQLNHIRFSPDGNLILAQDDSSISVLSRSPLKRLFTMDAPGAHAARFTPDSTHLVFHYPNMRVERWNVATGKRESFFELVDYEGCGQTSLSPDGKTFVCMSRTRGGVWLKLTDVDSGYRFYDNKNFYEATRDLVVSGIMIVRSGNERRIGSAIYSQDGKTMIVLCGAKALAFDLVNRKPIDMGHDLTRLIDGRTAFVDSDKLLFECDWDYKSGTSHDTFKMCETSFPDGLPLNDFKIGYQWLEPVSRGSHVLIGPFKENAAVLADPSTGKGTAGFKMDTLDVFDTRLAAENERGGVTLSDLDGQHAESVELPVSPLTDIDAAAFSPDGRFVAYSSRARSSIWDLNTQKRVALMRPFRDVRFSDQNVMFAQYRETHQRPGQNYQIDLKTGKAAEGAKFDIEQMQIGDVLVTFKELGKNPDDSNNVNMQVADGSTGTLLWSRHYPNGAPLVRQYEDGTLMLTSSISSSAAQDDINHPKGKLLKSSDWKGEWVSMGLFIEIVDAHTGEVRREIQVPARWEYGDNEDVRWAALYGDFLVVHGNHNNSDIYRASDGVRLGAFYGRVLTGDGKLGLLAATNRDQEVIVYDARNGKELKRVVVDHFPRAARFVAAKNALLVLTANQTVYTVDLPPANSTTKASSQP